MRPTIEDVPPFYRPYLAKVEGDNVEWILTQARQETLSVLENIDEAKAKELMETLPLFKLQKSVEYFNLIQQF